MDLPTALLRDLLHLTSSIDLGQDALTGPLIALVEDLIAAVPSYRGLELTIVVNLSPVRLTAFTTLDDDGGINSSLRFPFAVLGGGFDLDSRIVLYAATPGAFVDLAADLGYALNTPIIPGPVRNGVDTEGSQAGPHDGVQPRVISLDADLPRTTLESGLTGLAEVTTINRAVGMLIDQGHHPNHADTILRHHAATAGVQPHLYAAECSSADRPNLPSGRPQLCTARWISAAADLGVRGEPSKRQTGQRPTFKVAMSCSTIVARGRSSRPAASSTLSRSTRHGNHPEG